MNTASHWGDARIGDIARETGVLSPGELLPAVNRGGWQAKSTHLFLHSEQALWLRAAICFAFRAHSSPPEFRAWCQTVGLTVHLGLRGARAFAAYYPGQAAVVAQPPAGSQDYKRAMQRGATSAVRVDGASFQHHLEALTIEDGSTRLTLLRRVAAEHLTLGQLRAELRRCRPPAPKPTAKPVQLTLIEIPADPVAARLLLPTLIDSIRAAGLAQAVVAGLTAPAPPAPPPRGRPAFDPMAQPALFNDLPLPTDHRQHAGGHPA